MAMQNPFAVTTANDFTDEEIRDFWVDIDDQGGFRKLFGPTERSPKLFLGGKGSGKTHLMRYFSFALQRLRASAKPIAQCLREDGYVGVYLRCGGLDGGRFSGKGQSREAWSTLFAYYMDLRLSFHVLDIVTAVAQSNDLSLTGGEAAVCRQICQIFEAHEGPTPTTLTGMRDLFRSLQAEVDLAVNNAAVTRRLEVRIRSTPGRLVFGIPEILGQSSSLLSGVLFLFLIDQLEDLTALQQMYVHTLVRERRAPVSFRLGARTYGITYATLAAGEENRAGSEFDPIRLDEHLRKGERQYAEFARKLVRSRLQRAGVAVDERSGSDVDSFFEELSSDPLRRTDTQFVVDRPGERVYFSKLRKELGQAQRVSPALGIKDEATATSVVDALRCPDFPLLEKLNIFLLYRAWARSADLRESASEITRSCAEFLASDRSSPPDYAQVFSHYATDLFFQLCRDYEVRGRLYVGFDTFVRLSDGYPRNLLILLKNIFKWADFSGERPFAGEPISLRSQQRGVEESAEWFFREAPRDGGKRSLEARQAVGRLGELFRELVYSEKPPECSLTTFSLALAELPAEVQDRVKAAEDFSLLVSIQTGQKEKNSDRVDAKFQVNRFLSPKWGLPIGRRGAIGLSAEEAVAVFGASDDSKFDEARRKRVSRAAFPFGLERRGQPKTQELFPGSADD